MKSKKLKLVLVMGLFYFFIINFALTAVAEDDGKTITLKKASANYIETFTHGGHTYYYYDVYVTLHNSGTTTSNNMTVQIRDELGNITRSGSIGPGEDKTFVFKDYYISDTSGQNILVEYFATDQNERHEGNTGSKIIELQNNENDENKDGIPGFEAITFFIVAITIFLIYKKRKL